jgi:hypothetical protein
LTSNGKLTSFTPMFLLKQYLWDDHPALPDAYTPYQRARKKYNRLRLWNA